MDGGVVSTAADVLVVCYHAVSPRWRSPLSITPERLERQVSHVLARGYQPTTFTRAVLDPPAPRTVAVTFDDAFRSVQEVAAPVLARLGVPATVFVPTALIGGETPMVWAGLERWAAGPDAHELVGLEWAQLAELADAGWEIGSHTRTHARLPALGDAALAVELTGSRADCAARTGRPCDALAYPYGAVDGWVVAAAAAAGYRAAASPAGPWLGSATLAFPRICLYERDERSRLRAKLSPVVRRLQRSTVWAPLAGAARAVGV
jgi:peptidoglycan/xylan/chitin deacetylase (PgdA/CDA1 family)